MSHDLSEESCAGKQKCRTSFWKVIRVWAILTLISVLYPPVSQNLHALGTGEFVGYRFIFNESPFLAIDWGILVFEWLVIAGVLWLLVSKTRLFAIKNQE